MPRTENQRIREVQRLAENATPLLHHGEPGPGRGHKEPVAKHPRPSGMTKAYQVARIARDHPDILERMKAGEFSTVRQAAVAAGITKNPTHLDHFNKLWRKAGDEEKMAIAIRVERWLVGQPSKIRDGVNRRVAELAAEHGEFDDMA
jgi:hypothetical protein